MQLTAIVMMCLAVYASAMPMEESSCNSPWNYFMSIIGEEAMNHGKMLMMMKLKGSCLNLDLEAIKMDTKGELKQMKDCGLAAVTGMVKTIGRRPAGEKNFGHEDLMDLHKRIFLCKMSISNIEVEVGIDNEANKAKAASHIAKYSKDKATEQLLTETLNKCIDLHMLGGTGDEFVQQGIKAELCMANEILDSCAERKKSPGMIIRVIRAFMTLVDEPKCVAPVPPSLFIEPVRDCMKEINDEWTKNKDLPNKFTQASTDVKENIEHTFYFVKNYTMEIVMKVFGCAAKKVGNLKDTGNNYIMTDLTQVLEQFKNLEWADQTEKDAFINLFGKCAASMRRDSKIEELDTYIEMLDNSSPAKMSLIIKKHIMQISDFHKCFNEPFLKTCGLNNDLARVIYPILNYDIMNMFVQDFLSKGGSIAAMHLMGVLREKVDIADILNSI